MNIVITSQNRKNITAHAGKCRKFWQYEIVDKKIVSHTLIEVAREDSFSQSGKVLEQLQPMDIFVTAGMSEGLKRKMSRLGVEVMMTEMLAVDDFIQQLLMSELN